MSYFTTFDTIAIALITLVLIINISAIFCSEKMANALLKNKTTLIVGHAIGWVPYVVGAFISLEGTVTAVAWGALLAIPFTIRAHFVREAKWKAFLSSTSADTDAEYRTINN